MTVDTNPIYRKFRFRVWNQKTKKWVHGPSNEVNLFGETILFGEFMRVPIEDLNDCVAQQYTGLLDKNNKEIYEGDILRSPEFVGDNGEAPFSVSDVIYINGCFKLRNGYALSDYITTNNILEEDEIIGNIFDNPDYL